MPRGSSPSGWGESVSATEARRPFAAARSADSPYFTASLGHRGLIPAGCAKVEKQAAAAFGSRRAAGRRMAVV